MSDFALQMGEIGVADFCAQTWGTPGDISSWIPGGTFQSRRITTARLLRELSRRTGFDDLSSKSAVAAHQGNVLDMAD